MSVVSIATYFVYHRGVHDDWYAFHPDEDTDPERYPPYAFTQGTTTQMINYAAMKGYRFQGTFEDDKHGTVYVLQEREGGIIS